MDSTYTKKCIALVFWFLNNASLSNDYTMRWFSRKYHGFQKKFGSEVMPTERKFTMEILYNKYDILQLPLAYILASILMRFLQ
jgi:hypothetical protein